jgi:hypothetical protein
MVGCFIGLEKLAPAAIGKGECAGTLLRYLYKQQIDAAI